MTAPQTKIAQLRAAIGRIMSEKTPRGAMTRARKRRIHEAHNGLCVQCGEPVEMFGPTVRYDHEIPLELLGSDDDGNIGPIHRSPCDLIKTANDQAAIAKARRLRKADLEPRQPTRVKSAGFRKDVSRKFNGQIVRREVT